MRKSRSFIGYLHSSEVLNLLCASRFYYEHVCEGTLGWRAMVSGLQPLHNKSLMVRSWERTGTAISAIGEHAIANKNEVRYRVRLLFILLKQRYMHSS